MHRPNEISARVTAIIRGRTARLIATTSLAGLPFLAAHIQPAHAQTAAQSASVGSPIQRTQTPSGAGQLEQIVVTAQRRSEKLEKTPVAVTAITATALKQHAVTTDSDLQTVGSGLLVRQGISSNQVNYAIRGQSVDAFSNSQPGVLPYFNEVQDDAHSASGFYDLQSIQILKGPQGTLFGRNSTGGAVLITSAPPGNKFGGYVTERAGNYGYNETLGALDIPIVPDKVLLRVAGDYEHRSGYVHDVYTNTTPGTVLHESGRVSLTVKPNDYIQNATVVDFIHSGGTNTPSEVYSAYAPGSTNHGIPLNATAETFYSPFLDTAIGFPGAYAIYLAANPQADPLGLADAIKQQRKYGTNYVNSPGTYLHRSDNTIASNITTVNLGVDLTLKNILGFDRADQIDRPSLTGSPFAIELSQLDGNHDDSTDYSEEIQLLGKALHERLTYVTGFYYLNSKTYDPTAISILGLPPLIPPTLVSYSSDQISKTYAGYAQGTYDLSGLTGVQGLGFTAGLRYTIEDIAQNQLPGSALYNLPAPFENHLSQKATKLSWQFGAQEQLSPDLLLYVVSRHSFRSGGYTPTASPLPGTSSSGGAGFYPEVVTDVEIGEKYQGHIASVPFRVNADAFNQWINDAQRIEYIINPTTGGLSGLTVNVPKSEVTGFELDTEIRPFDWLDLGANVTYADARYTNGTIVVFGVPTHFGPYADTPKWSGSAFAELSEDLPQEFGRASLRADIFAQSKFFFSNLANTVAPGTAIAGYGLVDFRAAIDNIKGSGFSLAGYVRNAFDHQYYAGGIAAGPAIGVNSVQPGLPRMFFVEGTYKF